MKRLLILSGILLGVLLLTPAVRGIGPGDILGGIGDAIDVARVMTIGTKEEIGIGHQIHPGMVARFGGEYHNPALKSYVNRIGQQLAKKSGRPNIPYTFTILNTNMVNAFATMGGYVYVTKGLLKTGSDEAELAAVVGHEIGHIVRKHSLNRVKQIMVASKVMKYSGHLARGVVGDLENLFFNLAITGHGRKQELDADRLGIQTANSAGYDPKGAVRFFEHLLALEGKGSAHPLDQFFSSHPPTKKRIKLVNEEIAKLSPLGARTNKNAYISMRNRVH